MPASCRHLNKLLVDKPMVKKVSLFARWPSDRLFYPVELLKLDQSNRKAYVRFTDGTEFDPNLSDIHLQFLNDDIYDDLDDIVCCMCDGEESERNNEIVICEICQQGFHQKCHEPKVQNSILQTETDWTCETCHYIMNQAAPKSALMQPCMLSSTPKVMKKSKYKDDQINEPVASKEAQFKAPKATRVKLPPPPKIKSKKKEQEPPIEEVEAITPQDSSSDGSLTETLKKLTTDGIVDTVPTKVIQVAQALASREVPDMNTAEFVGAISEDKDSEAEPIPAIKPVMAPNKGPIDSDNGTEAIKRDENKPIAKKISAKRVIPGRAPRKQMKNPPMPA